MSQTVEIRLQLLRDIGAGLSKRETIKHLKEKFGITESAGYYHFATREKWLGQYLDFGDKKELKFNILSQFNNINREASFQYSHAKDDNAKIGYLRTRLAALSKLAEYAGFSIEEFEDKPDGYTLKWKGETSIADTLKEQEQFNDWIKRNCMTEEQKTIRDMTRIWIRYEYDTNSQLKNEGENIH